MPGSGYGSDDSDDDSLFENNVGLAPSNKNKRQRAVAENETRARRFDVLTEALKEDERFSAFRRNAASARDDGLLVQRVEQILARENRAATTTTTTMQHPAPSASSQQQQREPGDVNEGDDEETAITKKCKHSAELAIRTSVQETAGSDLWGTRRHVIPLVCRRKPLADLREVVVAGPAKLRRLVAQHHKRDTLSLMLEKKLLLKNASAFSAELQEWLWQCATAVHESDSCHGAYITLKAYYQKTKTATATDATTTNVWSVTKMQQQFQEWFVRHDDKHNGANSSATVTSTQEERDEYDELLDLYHWLDLWCTILSSSTTATATTKTVHENDSTIIDDIMVQLSQVVLDEKFNIMDSRVASCWSRTMSVLWNKRMNHEDETVATNLVQRIRAGTHLEESQWLSHSLMARHMLRMPPTASSTAATSALGLQFGWITLASLVGCRHAWEAELKRLGPRHEWLEPLWNTPHRGICYVTMAFTLIDEANDDITLNGPRILACLWTIQSCLERTAITGTAAAAVSAAGTNDEGHHASVQDGLNYMEGKVTGLIKTMMRLSSQQCFTRSEVALSRIRLYLRVARQQQQEEEEERGLHLGTSTTAAKKSGRRHHQQQQQQLSKMSEWLIDKS